jgi:Asp-tRNA(Asn)/Glu-tRNA(Gln) amidotransferase A subunit family amidase
VTPLEIGSDIGGSLRVPANFCGVFSHKPTWGTVSQRGHVPPHPGSYAERDLNVVGPMARSARDLRLLLSVMETGPLAPKAPAADLNETRIGVWLDEPLCPVDPEVRAAAAEGLELWDEEALSIAWTAYEAATGHELPSDSFTISYPPLDPSWDFDFGDDEEITARLPRLSALFAYS